MRLIVLACLTVLTFGITGCGDDETPSKPSSQPATTPENPDNPKTKVSKTDRPPRQTDHATSRHILIAFEGAALSTQKPRSREDAEKLADDIAKRARAGEDFLKLVHAHSNDPYATRDGGKRIYRNFGVELDPDRPSKGRGKDRAFCEVLFNMAKDEIAIVPHDARTQPYGIFVVKRVE